MTWTGKCYVECTTVMATFQGSRSSKPTYIASSYIGQHSKAGQVIADTFYYSVIASGNYRLCRDSFSGEFAQVKVKEDTAEVLVNTLSWKRKKRAIIDFSVQWNLAYPTLTYPTALWLSNPQFNEIHRVFCCALNRVHMLAMSIEKCTVSPYPHIQTEVSFG